MGSAGGVEGALRAFADAVSKADADAVDGLLSKRSIRVIGTDPKEYWGPDPAEVSRLFRAQVEAMDGQVAIVLNESEGETAGDVGWVAANTTVRLPDGTEVPTRFTGVLKLEDEQWRFVQIHFSIGMANEDALGGELPTE